MKMDFLWKLLNFWEFLDFHTRVHLLLDRFMLILYISLSHQE